MIVLTGEHDAIMAEDKCRMVEASERHMELMHQKEEVAGKELDRLKVGTLSLARSLSRPVSHHLMCFSFL